MVITNSTFTKSAIELAKKNNVQLWDRKTLIEKIDDLVYENYQIKCYSNGILKDVIYLGNI